MNTRLKKATIYVVITLLLMIVASFIVLSVGRTYRVKDNPIHATGISWCYLESDSFSTDNLLDYIDKTGINTVILPLYRNGSSTAEINGMKYIFSENENYENTDFISQLKNKLARKKVQLYISLDCDGLSAEKTGDILANISKKYKPAAIVLENCNYDAQTFSQLKETICSNSRNTQIINKAYRTIDIPPEDFMFDGYIIEQLNTDSYKFFKEKYPASKVLLHYASDSAASDSFILTNFADFDGVVAVQYIGENTPNTYLQTVLTPNNNLEKFGFTVSDDFTVTYPTKDLTTYYSGIFVTGTGAENTVNINGKEYLAQRDGTFGVYVSLEEGEHTITVTSKGKTYTYTVTKKSYKTSNKKYEAPWDNTEHLARGRVVQTTAQLTSMLSNPDDDSAIIAGLEAGTKLIVKESVQTTRDGYKTYAYKLSNGGYVLANKVEITDFATANYTPEKAESSSANSVFETSCITSASIEQLKNGDEQLYIAVSNNPAVVHGFSQEKLTLLFLDAEIENITLPRSRFYTDYIITPTDAGTLITLILNQNNPLWGYDVKMEDGQARIYLKQTPHLTVGNKPLSNITIMLDAGHGGKDSGALGIASTYGPIEKDLNLAVAKATKTILESYGATVYMTREDDSFPSLDDRRNMTRDMKPDLFIAMHHNSMDYSYNSTNVKGSECYYFTHQSKNLAQLLCENVTTATDRQNRGAFNGYYYVTRTDIAPSVLMEYSFIINPDDYSTTYSDINIYKAAFGTAMAVLKAIPQ